MSFSDDEEGDPGLAAILMTVNDAALTDMGSGAAARACREEGRFGGDWWVEELGLGPTAEGAPDPEDWKERIERAVATHEGAEQSRGSAGETLLHWAVMLTDHTGQVVTLRLPQAAEPRAGAVTCLAAAGVGLSDDLVLTECDPAGRARHVIGTRVVDVRPAGTAPGADEWLSALDSWTPSQVHGSCAALEPGATLSLRCVSCQAWRAAQVAVYVARRFGTAAVNAPCACPTTCHDGWGPFDGATSLHIAIAHCDAAMCRFLLALGADVRARAYGSVFQPGNPTYWGEYPLSFAVSLGRRDIAEALIAGRDEATIRELVFAQDSYGNIAPHLAVIHARLGMYAWLDGLGRRYSRKRLDKMVDNPNVLGLTPLSLASELVRTEDKPDLRIAMFEQVLASMRCRRWHFGRVACYSIPLEQIDTVYAPGTTVCFQSVLADAILHGNRHMLLETTLAQLLHDKWDRWAKPIYIITIVLHLFYVGLITSVTIAQRDELLDQRYIFSHFWDSLCLLMSVQRVCTSAIDIAAGRRKRKEWEQQMNLESRRVYRPSPNITEECWEKIQQARSGLVTEKRVYLSRFMPVNAYDWMQWIAQFLITLYFSFGRWRRTHMAKRFLAVSVVALWISSLKYSTVHKRTGIIVVMTIRAIKRDLMPFIGVLVIIICGYSAALYLLQTVPGQTYWEAMLELYRIGQGEKPTWSHSKAPNFPWLSYAVYITFSLLVFIVLTRILIAMFSQTFAAMGQDRAAEAEWRLMRSRAVLLLERRLDLLLPQCCRCGWFRVWAGQDEWIFHHVRMSSSVRDRPPQGQHAAGQQGQWIDTGASGGAHPAAERGGGTPEGRQSTQSAVDDTTTVTTQDGGAVIRHAELQQRLQRIEQMVVEAAAGRPYGAAPPRSIVSGPPHGPALQAALPRASPLRHHGHCGLSYAPPTENTDSESVMSVQIAPPPQMEASPLCVPADCGSTRSDQCAGARALGSHRSSAHRSTSPKWPPVPSAPLSPGTRQSRVQATPGGALPSPPRHRSTPVAPAELSPLASVPPAAAVCRAPHRQPGAPQWTPQRMEPPRPPPQRQPPQTVPTRSPRSRQAVAASMPAPVLQRWQQQIASNVHQQQQQRLTAPSQRRAVGSVGGSSDGAPDPLLAARFAPVQGAMERPPDPNVDEISVTSSCEWGSPHLGDQMQQQQQAARRAF